jgi:hypothetical protein
MTCTPNAVAAKGAQMAIRSLSALIALEPNSSESRVTSSRLTKLIVASCLGLLTVGSTGCSITSNAYRSLTNSECIDEFMVDYRNRAMAEKAWHCQKHLFGNHQYPNEFKAGFIAGYLDIANGGAGCCPNIAPAALWGWRYQSAQGQAAINAWFEGFPMGVRAAEQDGIGSWQEIRMFGCGAGPAGGGVPTMPADMETPGPYYQDQDFDPGMFQEEEVEMHLDGGGAVMPPQPEAVLNGTFNGFPLSEFGDLDGDVQFELDTSNDELVSRFDVAQLPKADEEPTSASIDDLGPIEIVGPAQSSVAPDVDPFGGQASDELPFSFE